VTAADFHAQLAAVTGREGVALSSVQITRIVEQYRHCPGREPWAVRAYARAWSSQGAREYRVMRGSSVHEVYVSPLLDSATAVGAALNELESSAGWVDFRGHPEDSSR
jgi:hypothetical protein